MPIREVTESDADALRQFFSGLSAEDRTFFWEDVTAAAGAASWAGDTRRAPHCAVENNDQIAAFAALVPSTEWSSHVAELVLVVARSSRRQGLGRSMARTMLVAALRGGFTKVTVQVAADHPGAIAMFQGIGFQAEALLRDHLRTPEDGTLRDLVILSHLVDDTYSTMITAGFDKAIG
jgi:RimJ/RimL family protein N-acetyltransferase